MFLCEEGLSLSNSALRGAACNSGRIHFQGKSFPIFDLHFTISLSYHKKQQIEDISPIWLPSPVNCRIIPSLQRSDVRCLCARSSPLPGRSGRKYAFGGCCTQGRAPGTGLQLHLRQHKSFSIWSGGTYLLQSKSRSGIDTLSRLMSSAQIVDSTGGNPV